MRVIDLKPYIFDKVVIYKSDPNVDGEFIPTLSTSTLNMEIRTIGAKRRGIIDILVE